MKIQKLLTIALLINPTAIYAGLNDTGITTCSNETQNGLPCPVAGFPGQDAEYGTNSFNFTKLDANGNAMSVTATNHVCVKDNVTGLIWEVNTYTSTFDTAPQLATAANAANRCGYNDWRLPNPHELVSIVDYSDYNPPIDENFFTNTSSTYFWTNAMYAADSSYSWFFYFYYGYVNYRRYYYSNAVRLVRGGQWLFPFAFINQGDGTVTEQKTGLMWAKCSVGQGATDCSGSESSLTWQQALQAADSSTLAGYSDWRLPNVKELQTLVDYTKYNPSINSTYFPNTFTDYYWTNSQYAAASSGSWIVHFGTGYVDSSSRGNNHAVRLVRAGQLPLPFFSLSMAKTGNGTGSITSNPAGINCGSDCNENYASGTVVTLTATPYTGSVFTGWSGDADCNDGTVAMKTEKHCTATFNIAVTAPAVSTNFPSVITSTSATLQGTVNPNGAVTSVTFDFGTTISYGTNIMATPTTIAATAGATAVSANKTGLTCGTPYHYRVKAVNSIGTSRGTDKTFTTSTCPIYTVTPNAGTGGRVSPSTAQTVNYGATKTFTVTANSGYTINSVVTGSCPQGNWTENFWTTGAITASCNVSFSFIKIQTNNAWLNPPTPKVIIERPFALDVIVNSGGRIVGNYDFLISYDVNKIGINFTQCNGDGVCVGNNGWNNFSVFHNTTIINGAIYGTINIYGTDQTGSGPSNDLQLLKVYFKAKDVIGPVQVNLTIQALRSTSGYPIGSVANGATVNVSPALCGDADGNAAVNIVDALAIARKLVGLPPPPTIEPLWANVNTDNTVTIIDALHIARYAVGLVLPPEVCNIAQPL